MGRYASECRLTSVTIDEPNSRDLNRIHFVATSDAEHDAFNPQQTDLWCLANNTMQVLLHFEMGKGEYLFLLHAILHVEDTVQVLSRIPHLGLCREAERQSRQRGREAEHERE